MIAAFLLSVRQLGDRRIVAVLAKSLAVTIALLVLLAGLLAGAAHWIARDWFSLGDTVGALAAAVAILVGIAAAWLLFRIVAIAILNVFADDVVAAVEARHYPVAAARARPTPFARSVAMGMRSALRAALVNAAMVPVYVLLLATGIGTAIAFFVVNGWLLGRDLDDMVAARHLSPAAMRVRRATTRGSRFATGLAGTGLLMVPLVNFVAPVLAAAMATHRYHRGKP